MNKLFNKKSALVCAGVAGALVLGASMAYFTDYAVTSAEGTAGTVAIALDSEINLLDANGMDILNPGDQRDGAFTVTNMGNKSIDVRETIALTALDREGNPMAFTGDAESQSEFDLYLRSDVEEVPGEGFKPMAGAKPLAVKEINGNVITYTLPEYSLNGNADEYAEVETIEGVDAFAKENDFVLVFKGEAGNDWQAAEITVDVIVEAKQHENTGAGWDIVAQEQVSQGSITKDVVMAEEVITQLEASNGGASEEITMYTITLRTLNDDGTPLNNPVAINGPEGWSFEGDGATDDDGYQYIFGEGPDGLGVTKVDDGFRVPTGDYTVIDAGSGKQGTFTVDHDGEYVVTLQ